MTATLILPDGVRLIRRDELPGNESARAEHWARIQRATLAPGFVITRGGGEGFALYAEANVHATQLFAVFHDLCHTLLETDATLLLGEIDDDPRPLGTADVSDILRVLGRFKYQLAHDGFLQFGAISDHDSINEVFVAPTKHLKIWANDETRLRSVMEHHGVPEASRLEFLDQFPRATTKLAAREGVFGDFAEFAQVLEAELATAGRLR